MTKKVLEKWMEHIHHYRLPVLRDALGMVELHGKGIELGAGTCWLSSTLSQMPSVEQLFVVECDRERLQLARDYFFSAFGYVKEKIELIEDDFHLLPFKDASVDFVICDAALHHAEKLQDLLGEVRRVLKPHGTFLALREPVLPSMEPLRTWRRLTFGWRERLRGDIEKTHTKQEWQKFFAEAGFSLALKECFAKTTVKESLVSILRKWNGVLFSRYYFIAKPL